jgi:hypothetical protein
MFGLMYLNEGRCGSNVTWFTASKVNDLGHQCMHVKGVRYLDTVEVTDSSSVGPTTAFSVLRQAMLGSESLA